MKSKNALASMTNNKKPAPKTAPKEEPKKMRVSSAKAGTSQKTDPDYFPPQNSVAFSELQRIAEATQEGVDVWSYKLSEMFLGRIIRVGLVNCTDGKLYATERLYGIIDGSISVSRGSEFNKVHAALKKATTNEEIKALTDRLVELASERFEERESA